MAENNQTEALLEDNPALERKRAEIRSGTMDSRLIEKGDTIAQLAREYGVHDYHDLVTLNQIAGTSLKVSGSKRDKVTIRAGETIKVPRDPEVFARQIAEIRRINQIQQTNKALETGATKDQVKTLRGSVETPLFPGFRQSLGMHRLNAGLIGNLQASMHMDAPRQVDSKFEGGTGKRMASCAHYYRQVIRSAINPGDMPEEWVEFMNKEDIDAWELPAELLTLKVKGKNEFVRTHNFMSFFDTSKFGNKNSPVLTGKEKEYASALAELDQYLQKPEAKNSVIPIYYQFSNFQKKGLEQGTKDPHYNTHMIRNVGMANITFSASEFGEVRDGAIIPFGSDEKKLRKEIGVFQSELVTEKKSYEERKAKLEQLLATEFQSDYKFYIDKHIDAYVKNLEKDPLKAEKLRNDIAILIATEDTQKILGNLGKLIHYNHVTEDDARLLVHWQRRKRLVQKEIEQMRENLAGAKKEAFPEFQSADFKALLDNNTSIRAVFEQYGTSAKKIKGLDEKIAALRYQIQVIAVEKENEAGARQKAEKELVAIHPEMMKEKEKYEMSKKSLLEALDENKSESLQKYLNGFEERTRTHFGPGRAKKADALIAGFKSGATGTDLQSRLEMSDADFNYLKRLYQSREKVRTQMNTIRSSLGKNE